MPKYDRDIGIPVPGFNAAVVKQDADGWKYLVFQRAETEPYGGFWSFLTGSKLPQETVAQAVCRDVKTQTGLSDFRMFATEYLVQFYEPENDKLWILPLIVVVVTGPKAVSNPLAVSVMLARDVILWMFSCAN